MMKKRGQDGKGAAVLVSIIAAFIILYILFLEPSDRESLLGSGSGSSKTVKNGVNIDKNITVLLEEKPGRLEYIKGQDYEMDLPSFTLYKTTNSVEIESFNDLSVRNGWMDKKSISKEFSIDDLENTENVVLSFVAKKHEGSMTIMINGNTVFEGYIDTLNVEPIKLAKSYLKEGINILNFSVSGVGMAFWRTNEYSLSNVKVIGDITDVSKQKTKNIFTIESWKYTNLEKATLKFNPNCNSRDVGALDVFVNNKNIFSGLPDCGMLNKYEIPVGVLNTGVNDVVFLTNGGTYLVDQLKVKLELQEASNPLYYFEITDKQMENITKGRADVNISMKFVDDDEDKTLDLNINGHMKRVDQKEPLFSYVMTDWVEESSRNYIKLIPKTTVDIISLKVLLVRK
jgi:hypothetical protein